ncbi:response regulator [Nocardiopsis sediminis]|uniref:Response regulator n=1 Tax=Nocardiopsis sediminis TaxID=1778267 RepID=A0ABV8FMC5_9ACTN
MQTIRMLLADDHTLFRNALTELLHMEDDLRVVGVASDVNEALKGVEEHRPDVALLDIHMPGNDQPRSTVRRVRQISPGTQVLILTMYDDARLARDLLPLGIRGYLHKTVTGQVLTSAVREAAVPNGRVTLSMSSDVLTEPEEKSPLSPREMEVLELAARGRSNHQIARQLGITEGTVKRHMRNIFDKLAAQSRVEAANIAIAAGIIASPVTVPPARRPMYTT